MALLFTLKDLYLEPSESNPNRLHPMFLLTLTDPRPVYTL